MTPEKIILSLAIIPQEDVDTILRILKLPLNEDKFFMEAHVKLRPVDFAFVNSALCKGCGSCASVCPSGAMQYLGYREEQTLIILNKVLEVW